MKVDILGTEWSITQENTHSNEKLNHCDGYCDNTIKKMVIISEIEDDPMNVKEIEEYKKVCQRHEIIHAYLYESGLANNSEWALNEEMVDWVARQFPKLEKTFRELNIL